MLGVAFHLSPRPSALRGSDSCLEMQPILSIRTVLAFVRPVLDVLRQIPSQALKQRLAGP